MASLQASISDEAYLRSSAAMGASATGKGEATWSEVVACTRFETMAASTSPMEEVASVQLVEAV